MRRTEEQRRARRKRAKRLRASLLNEVPREIIEAVCDARPSLDEESVKVKQSIAYLAWCSLFPHRVHRELPEYLSVHNEELLQRFGRDKFKPLNAKHEVFNVVKAARPGLTDAYQLQPDIRDAINLRVRMGNEAMSPVSMVLPTGKRRLKLAPAITRESLHRTPASPWRDAEVERIVPVDMDALLRLEQRLRELLPMAREIRLRELASMHHDGTSDVPELIGYLDLVRQMTRTDLGGTGVIVHRYAQKDTGRLFAEGINLQAAPRIVKRAALNGMHAYDFSNCHFAMIAQLAEREGLRLPALADLLANKD